MNKKQVVMLTKNTLLSITVTFLAAIPAGFLFYFLRIPLPWLLGPIVAILVYNSVGHHRPCWPVSLRDLALIIVGYSMGRTITADTIHHILLMLPSIVIITLLTLLFSLVVGYFTHLKTGISLSSGILGNMPGGLFQMVLLSEEIKDANITVVIFMQTIRILTVVFLVPFIATYGIAPIDSLTFSAPESAYQGLFSTSLPGIAMAPLGAWLACRCKLPTPYLLGPIFGTAAAGLCGYPAPACSAHYLQYGSDFYWYLHGSRHHPEQPEATPQTIPLCHWRITCTRNFRIFPGLWAYALASRNLSDGVSWYGTRRHGGDGHDCHRDPCRCRNGFGLPVIPVIFDFTGRSAYIEMVVK